MGARHSNLFGWVADSTEYYAKLQSDFTRDDRKVQLFTLMAMIGFTYFAMQHAKGLEFFALEAAFFGTLMLFITYIDHANRNFMMHMIDWHMAREGEAKAAEREAERERNRAHWAEQERAGLKP